MDTEEALFIAGVGLPRMIYCGDSAGIIRELNNSFQYPNEAYIANVSSHVNGGNTGTALYGNTTATVPSGIPNGQISMAAEFRSTIQQIWLFYQAQGNNITVHIRNADTAGNWTTPSAIPVGLP